MYYLAETTYGSNDKPMHVSSLPLHFCLRLVDVNVEDRDPCKQKKKTKERKELWDSLLEVYEKEVHTTYYKVIIQIVNKLLLFQTAA